VRAYMCVRVCVYVYTFEHFRDILQMCKRRNTSKDIWEQFWVRVCNWSAS